MSDIEKAIPHTTSPVVEKHDFSAPKSVPLCDAWNVFADIGAEGLQAAKRCMVLLEPPHEGAPSDEGSNVYQMYEPKNGRERFNAHLRRKRFLFEHLFANLSEGKLDAAGIQITPTLANERTTIPAAIFADIFTDGSEDHWNKNLIELGSLRFGSVEVRLSSSTPVFERQTGRPATEGIEAAIASLMASKKDFANLTRSQQCDLVRTHILGFEIDQTNPPKGYRDGAIKKRLRQTLSS